MQNERLRRYKSYHNLIIVGTTIDVKRNWKRRWLYLDMKFTDDIWLELVVTYRVDHVVFE